MKNQGVIFGVQQQGTAFRWELGPDGRSRSPFPRGSAQSPAKDGFSGHQWHVTEHQQRHKGLAWERDGRKIGSLFKCRSQKAQETFVPHHPCACLAGTNKNVPPQGCKRGCIGALHSAAVTHMWPPCPLNGRAGFSVTLEYPLKQFKTF